MLLNPGEDLIITEPTGPMLVTVLLPELHKALEDFGLTYEFKVAERIFYVTANGHTSRIICLSMENYNRIRGQNVCAVLADEAATTKNEILLAAVDMFKARLRAGSVRQIVLVSTPENMGALYTMAVKKASEYKSTWFKACTLDNPHVPKEFIEDMKSIYTKEQVRSYIYGEFSNLQSGAVYPEFDRINNHASVEISEDDHVHIGIDFNTNSCCITMGILQDNQLFIFDEAVRPNTREVCEYIVERFGADRVTCYPDSSGSNSHTSSSQTDHDIITSYGLIIDAPKANPGIINRVIALNSNFYHRLVWVDTDRAKNLTEALEIQAWDGDRPEKFSNHGTEGSIDDRLDSLVYVANRLLPLIKPTITNTTKYKGA